MIKQTFYRVKIFEYKKGNENEENEKCVAILEWKVYYENAPKCMMHLRVPHRLGVNQLLDLVFILMEVKI